MELTKEIELIILTRIAQKGKIADKDFDHLFENNHFEYSVALSRMIKASCDRIVELNQSITAADGSRYFISESGELKRKALQREKNSEKVADVLRIRLIKHIDIVETGTRFLLVISVVTMLAAMYLIRLESADRQLQNPKPGTANTR
ncbi:MAG TPA: hypothetical protein VGH64_10005 [Puia sp.]|jgi:hypothetical protein